MTDDTEKPTTEIPFVGQYKIQGDIMVTAFPTQFRFDGESMEPLGEPRKKRFFFDLDMDTARKLVSDLRDVLPPATN